MYKKLKYFRLLLIFLTIVFCLGTAFILINIKYKNKYTNAEIKYQLYKIYHGYYMNERWIPVPIEKNINKMAWRKNWEKHGYKFISEGTVTHVLDPFGYEVATIYNDQMVMNH